MAAHTAADVRSLCEAYLEAARQVERTHRPLDGMFGFGQKTADAPCHSRFLSDLEALLGAIAGEEPDSRLVREILTYLYRLPLENRQPPAVHWILVAAQGATTCLIGRLDSADAGALWRAYRKDYPRWDRLPVQDKVLALLGEKR